MEAGFYVVVHTFLLLLGNSEGFQIVHVQKQQCLYKNQMVAMGLCNETKQDQQWMWTENDKLLHVKSSLCLGISNSSHGPHRRVILTQCSQAPQWTCYEQGGLLEMKNTSLFLRKQGNRVVVKKDRKYLHSWMKMDVNEKGKLVNESLCLKRAHLAEEVSVRNTGNTDPPPVPTAFNAVTYSMKNPIRNVTEAFTMNTAEIYSQSSSEGQSPYIQTTGITETPWVQSTSQMFSSTTEERSQPCESHQIREDAKGENTSYQYLRQSVPKANTAVARTTYRRCPVSFC